MRTQIEKTIYSYLSTRLPVPVSFEVPPGPPALYATIEKTGGHLEDGIYTATFAIKSIGKDLLEVVALNERIVDVMPGLADEKNIFRCHLEGDYDFTNTKTKERRYQAVFEIVYV